MLCIPDEPDEAEGTTIDKNEVIVISSDNEAVFTWPVTNNSATYALEITKDGVVFCTLTFDSWGRLLGIAFAPGKNGNKPRPAATLIANGYQFIVTGLEASSPYAYSLKATDQSLITLASYKGAFTTTGTALPSVDVTPPVQVIGSIVLCNEAFCIYNLTGQEVTAMNGSLPAGVYIVRTAGAA